MKDGQPETSPPDADCGEAPSDLDLFEDGIAPFIDPELVVMGFPYAKGLLYWQKQFLVVYEGNISAACRELEIDYQHFKLWMRRHKDGIAQAFRFAMWMRLQEMRKPTMVTETDERKMMLTELARDVQEQSMTRIKAIETLCKLDGEFVDKQELTGAGGGALIIETGVPQPTGEAAIDVVAKAVEDDDDRDEDYADMDPDEEDA